ncbi:MAG: ABC transporter ATP-binding protein [Spirochaetes bacterium]|nr:ABC transporter ATP-binding protein [Spirochaetota bacterium]
MIELKNISKIYQNGFLLKKPSSQKKAVDSLNLTIDRGVYGLLGVNGAGKTTTIKMMCTLLKPTSGEILLGGINVVQQEKKIRPLVNMVTGSDRMLYFRLTGRENLLYFASLYHLQGKKAKQKTEALLELVGLTKAADQRVERYSRGMKQRLSIARGLINDPQYLFLDEPTLGLDVQFAREIRTFIKEKLVKKNNRTLILTSHYMSEIEELCEKIGILFQGKLIFNGTFADLYQQLGLTPVHHFLFDQHASFTESILKKSINLPFSLTQTPDEQWILKIKSHQIPVSDVIANLSRIGIKTKSYLLEKTTLEDAVIKLNQETRNQQ